jgi:hypothetical protein
MIFNAPCDLFLGLFDLGLVSIVKDGEKFWVNLEIFLSDVEVRICSSILLDNLAESFPQILNLNSNLLLFSVGESQPVVFLSSQLRLLD